MSDASVKWLHELRDKGGKGVVNNLDARALGRIGDELEFLQFFYLNADFGPAHGDVMTAIKGMYVEETGNKLPEGYADED